MSAERLLPLRLLSFRAVGTHEHRVVLGPQHDVRLATTGAGWRGDVGGLAGLAHLIPPVNCVRNLYTNGLIGAQKGATNVA